MPVPSGQNKDEDTDQLKQEQQVREARRQQQAELAEKIRLYRQRQQDLRRKREDARRHIRTFFMKLHSK